MKKKLITVLLLLIICGCTNNESQTNLTMTDPSAESTPEISLSQVEASSSISPNLSSTPTPSKYNEDIIFTIENKDIAFHFDMLIEEAITFLNHANIDYQQKDDISLFRSWSGRCLKTPFFELVFDLRGLLHEIIITKIIESNLPIMVDDLVVDMYAKLGEAQPQSTPGAFGAIALLYSNYDLDNYYLKATYYEDRIPFEEYVIDTIIVSKYSAAQYREKRKPATLIFTNKNDEQADFYIGMSLDEVKAQLDVLELDYRINNSVLSGESYDYLPEYNLPDGYDFKFYYDRNYRVCTVEIYGPGVLTQQGLQVGDSEEKMLELYGDSYKKIEFDNEFWRRYIYISGDNYLDISTSTEIDPSAPVAMLEITRYTDNKLKWGIDFGIK